MLHNSFLVHVKVISITFLSLSQAEEGGVGAEDVGPSGEPSRTYGPTRTAHASVKGRKVLSPT